MADDGNSAVNEQDVPAHTSDHLRPPEAGDPCVAPVVTADSRAADDANETVTPAGDDSSATQPPLLSVDDALRSIARPTPISIVEPVVRAVNSVSAGCRRATPRLLPSGLSHALAIGVGCAIGWYAHWHHHAAEDAVAEVTWTPSGDAVVMAPTPLPDGDTSDDDLFGVFAPLPGSPRVVTESPEDLLVPAAPPAVLPSPSNALSMPPEQNSPPPSPARGQFGFTAPQVATPPVDVPSLMSAPSESAPPESVPSESVPPETVTRRPTDVAQPVVAEPAVVALAVTASGVTAPQPIEVPNDAVSLDAAEPVTAPTAVTLGSPDTARTAAAATLAATNRTPSGTSATALPVAGAQAYSSDDLVRALADTHRVVGCPDCQSTGLDVSTPEGATSHRARLASHTDDGATQTCAACGGLPAARFTAEGYEALCRLADVATFVRVEAHDAETWSVRDQSRQLLSIAIGQRDRLNKTGRLAGFRLDDPARAQNGILLAGTVVRVSYLGSLYHSEVVLFGVPRHVTVVSEREPPFGAGQRVAVLGSIVDRPVENLRGYQGEVEQVVWGGLPLVLSD